jgi:hypothetical protein
VKATHKTSPFDTQSRERMRDEVLSEAPRHTLATAPERFATVLRTASVETLKTDPRDLRNARSIRGEYPPWTATSESDWRRYIGHIRPSTIH